MTIATSARRILFGNPTIARDSFDRNDSTTTLGAPWTALSGTWGVNSAKAYVPTASDGQEAVQAGRVNLRLEADITFATQGVADNGPGLIVRCTDASNYVMCRIQQTSGRAIWKRIGGTFTNLVTTGAGGVNGQTYHMQVDAQGDRITLFLDGVFIAQVTLTDAILITGTQIGLRSGDENVSRWKNFIARRL